MGSISGTGFGYKKHIDLSTAIDGGADIGDEQHDGGGGGGGDDDDDEGLLRL